MLNSINVKRKVCIRPKKNPITKTKKPQKPPKNQQNKTDCNTYMDDINIPEL